LIKLEENVPGYREKETQQARKNERKKEKSAVCKMKPGIKEVRREIT
jgi:hypothetical protein